jgi:predicted permease
VISEVALAVVLLISAGVLGRTLLRLAFLSPGLDIHNVLTAHVAFSPGVLNSSADTRAAWRALLDNLRQVPGVQSAALTDIVPMRVGENVIGYWATATPPPPNQAPNALASGVTPDYLNVMRIRLLRGRFFDENDKAGHDQVIVIDQKMAHHTFGNEDPVGKRVWVPAFGSAPVRVVGVVDHVRHWGLADDDQSQVQDQCYYPLAQIPDSLTRFFSSVMSVAIKTDAAPLSMVESLQQKARGAKGDQTLYEVRTMEQLVSASLSRQRFLLSLFGVFSAVALALACIGVYGVLAYLTSERIPEFGVRMALGATTKNVLQLVLRQGLGMTLIGVGIGSAMAVIAGRLLEHLVAGVVSTEPVVFLIMVAVLMGAALLASYIPARRAAQTDPLRALRYE